MSRKQFFIVLLLITGLQFGIPFSMKSQPSELKESGLQVNFNSGSFSHSVYAFECGYGVADWKDLLEEDICAPLEWVDSPDSMGCMPGNVSLDGKIVLIRSGHCQIGTKVRLAQEAGALAVIILSNLQFAPVWHPEKFELNENNELPAIRIPAFYVSQVDFEPVQTLMEEGNPMSVCLKRPAIFFNSVTCPTEIQQFCTSPLSPFRFSARLSNISGVTLHNVVLTGVLQRYDESTVVTSTLHLPEVDASVQDSLYEFPDIFSDILTIPEWHFVTYTVQGEWEGQPFSDIRKVQFDAYAPWYAKEIFGNGYYRPDSIPDQGWGVANLYYVTGFEPVSAPNVTVGIKPGEENSSDPFYVGVFLFEVKEDVLPDFSNFSTDNFASEHLTIVGVSSITVMPGGNTSFYTTYLQDFNTAEWLYFIEPNKRYLVAAVLEDSARYAYLNFDESHVASAEVSTLVFTDKWHLNGFYGRPNASLRMGFEAFDFNCQTGYKEPVLFDFRVYPNPSRNDLTVQTSFQETVESFIEITDMSSRTLLAEQRKVIAYEPLIFPVSQLPNGAYFIRITTKQGSQTRKFIVQKE